MRRLLPIVALVLVGLLLPAVASAAAGPGVGRVRGTVTPLVIAPEVEVCLVEVPLRPSEVCASPEPDGTYVLTGLPVEIPFKVEFIPSYQSHYAVQYYDHAFRLSEAEAIELRPPFPEAAGIDADLEIGGQIEGMVTAAGAGPLGEVEVCVLEAEKRVSNGCTDTDEGGAYKLGALSPGTYKLGFWGHGESAEYAPRYYVEASAIDQGAAISVQAGMTVTGVDASLEKGAQVRGTVIAAAGGAGLQDIPVCLFLASSVTPLQCIYTGPGGSYSLLGIPTGSYQVGFSLGSSEIGGEPLFFEDDGYLTQYFDGGASRAAAQTLILAAPQLTAGINAQLLGPTPPPAQATPAAATGPPATIVPAILESARKPKPRCKRGHVRKKVKGRFRCVRVAKGQRKSGGKKRHHSSPKRDEGRRNRDVALPGARLDRSAESGY